MTTQNETPKQLSFSLTRSTIESIYSASFCVSKDETRKALANLLIDLDNSKIVSIDGYKFVQFLMHENDIQSFTSLNIQATPPINKLSPTLENPSRIPLNGKACKELKRLLKDKKCLNYSVRFETFIDIPTLIFQAQGNPESITVPVSKLHYPQYQSCMPAVSKIVPEDYTDVSFSMTYLNDLLESLKLSQSKSDNRVEHIRLRIHKNTNNPILVNAMNNSEIGYDGILMPLSRYNPS